MPPDNKLSLDPDDFMPVIDLARSAPIEVDATKKDITMVLGQVLELLEPLSVVEQGRIIRCVVTFYDLKAEVE